ncbi:hypothetical protein [Pseudomonas pergaminensis]
MKKDWVVWCGCALLFGAGAIWGGILLDIQFLKVANIHDLFEIFSSAATVAAVFLAFAGVNAWRQQVGAQSDHALAQRIAVASLKYKDVSKSAFSDAQFLLFQFDGNTNYVLMEVFQKILPGLEERLNKNKTSHAEFLAVLQECRAIWGKGFSDKYGPLIINTQEFYNCVDAVSEWVRLDSTDHMKEASKFSVRRHFEKFEREGWFSTFASDLPMFDEWTMQADEEIRLKLIRPS